MTSRPQAALPQQRVIARKWSVTERDPSRAFKSPRIHFFSEKTSLEFPILLISKRLQFTISRIFTFYETRLALRINHLGFSIHSADLTKIGPNPARISHRFLLNGGNWLNHKELWDLAKYSAFLRWCSAETSKRQAREAVLSQRSAWSRMPIRSRRGSYSALPRIASRIARCRFAR